MTHGTNAQLYNFKLEYAFQDNALAELDRQLDLLLSTQVGTMPLDREFGIQQNYSDETYTAAVDCGDYTRFAADGAGYGLAQWTYPSRKAALLAFARAQGASIGDLDTQVGYLLQELQTLFKPLWDKLRTTDSVREASDCVLLQFERPASVNDPVKRPETMERRTAAAQEFFDQYNERGGDALKLLKCILTESDCYKAGAKIKPKGVMVHSTGADNPTLRRYVQPVASTPGREELLAALGTNKNGNHWNRPDLDVCVHGFVGRLADGSVAAVQTLPWDRRGWHAGTGTSGGSANDTHISFEICEDGLTDPAYFRQAYRTAVELTAMLCREYGLDPLADGVVICHQEGYRRGIASNHGDVLHWFPRHGKSMDDFRTDVARTMKEDDEMLTYEQWKEYMDRYRKELREDHDQCWAEEELTAAVAAGITDGKRPHDFVTREEAAIMAVRSKA